MQLGKLVLLAGPGEDLKPQTPSRKTLSGHRLGAQARGGVDSHHRSAWFRLHLHPAPRGPRVGGRNFPARGLSCPRPAGRPFLFTERKGNGKGGEEAGVGCTTPMLVQAPRVRSPQCTGPPAAYRPASSPPPVLRTPARLRPAGWPPAAHGAQARSRHTEHSGNRV